MKKLLVVTIGLFFSFMGYSQSCLPEGITFTTQAEIDNFQSNYPGCTEIEGDVQIQGSEITNLNGLSVLTSVGDKFNIVLNYALTSLTGLDNLTSIGDECWIIGNNSLTSLEGLNNLTSIGGNFAISNNENLTSLMGLNSLTSVGGDLMIGEDMFGGNPSLTSLAGLESLTSINGDLVIYQNDMIQDLNGIKNIDANSIINLSIHHNTQLYTCDVQSICDYLADPNGDVEIHQNAVACDSKAAVEAACATSACLLEGIDFTTQAEIDNFQTNHPGCTEIGGHVHISGGDITNLNGLNVLTSIGGYLIISETDALMNLTGLENLTTIEGYLQIDSQTSMTDPTGLDNLTNIGLGLIFLDNLSLTNLTIVSNVISVGGILRIVNNAALTNLTGLENINAGSIDDLGIFNNSNLSDCVVQSVCDYLASPGGTTAIFGNATGCNSKEEVKEACKAGLDDNVIKENYINIYPNPSTSQITIKIRTTKRKETGAQLYIYNTNSQLLITRILTEQSTVIDIGDLAQGIYYVKLTSDSAARVFKIVKNR